MEHMPLQKCKGIKKYVGYYESCRGVDLTPALADAPPFTVEVAKAS
jgi:hypothetical protein